MSSQIIFLSSILLVFSSLIYGQKNSTVDSLFEHLAEFETDAARIDFLGQEGWKFKLSDPVTSNMLIDSGLYLAYRINDEHRASQLTYTKGLLLEEGSQYSEALRVLKQRLGKLDGADQELESSYYLLIGRLNDHLYNLEEAVEYFLKALAVDDLSKDTVHQIVSRANIANIYVDMEEYKKALDLYEQSGLKIDQLLKTKNRKDSTYLVFVKSSIENKIGAVYQNQEEYKKALTIYRKSQVLLELLVQNEIDANWKYYQSELQKCYLNIGSVSGELGEFQTSIEYLRKSRRLAIKLEDALEIAQCEMFIGMYWKQRGGLDSAYHYFDRCYIESVAIGSLYLMLNAKREGADVLHQRGRDSLAFIYQKKFIQLNDSSLGLEKQREILALEARYQSAEQKKQIGLQNALLASQEAKISNRNWALAGMITTMLVFVLAAYLEIKRRKQISVKEQEIAVINGRWEAVETLRNSISLELHDGVGYALQSIASQLRMLFKDNVQAKSIIESLNNTEQQVRSLAHELAPFELRNVPLAEAVQLHIEKVSQSTVLRFTLDVYPENVLDNLDKNLARAMYRILQECTSNALRHADATSINIHYAGLDEGISFMFEDDGKGFDSTTVKEGSGFINIQKRCADVAATLHIDARPGRGTVINIEFPTSVPTHA